MTKTIMHSFFFETRYR